MQPNSRHIAILLWLTITHATAWAQKATFDTIATLPAPTLMVSTDQYNRFIVALENGSVLAIAPSGKILYEFSSVQLSPPTLLEANNTQKIALFYREWQQMNLLDRFLAPISQTHFDALTSGFVRLATLAQNNGIWLIDETNFELKKTNAHATKIEASTMLNLIIEPGNYAFTQMKAHQNQLFISDETNGILVFDNMANYIKTLPFANQQQLVFNQNNIIIHTPLGLEAYNLYTHNTNLLLSKALLPNEPFSYCISEGILYIITGNKILKHRDE